MDIQLILEFNNSFGKYHSVFPKNPFLGDSCTRNYGVPGLQKTAWFYIILAIISLVFF